MQLGFKGREKNPAGKQKRIGAVYKREAAALKGEMKKTVQQQHCFL